MAEPKVRGWLKLLGLAALLAAAGGLWAIYAGRGFHSAPTERTEKDFHDNAERLRFARNVLPFEVSDEVQVEKIHLVEWLDANFVCVLQLPPDEFKNLQGVIEAQWTGNPEEYRLESATWAYTAIPDEAEKTVTLRASSKPGH